ncbi:MAG: hypothetical protein ACE5FR_11540 [Rhodospirillales bacterium]
MGFLIGLFAFALVSAPASAQERYAPWAGAEPSVSADRERLQGFVDRLNALVDEGEKARAADPRFLRDLRGLARGYDRPWRRLVLADDFGDGNFTADPAWTVTAGRYWVEGGWGLRSKVDSAAAQPQQRKQGKRSGRDAALAILGTILGQPAGQGEGGGPAATGVAAAAAIHAGAPITNAFSIEIELSSWLGQGRLEFGPYQGAQRGAGYRLAYTPGGALELLRVSPWGSSVVERVAGPVTLEDKKPHRIEWTRRADGEMAVALDGKALFTAIDRGFTDPFDGFVMVNRGGDYIVKRLAIYGTE